MSKAPGRLEQFSVALEATPGVVNDTPDITIPFNNLSLRAVPGYTDDTSSTGSTLEFSDSVLENLTGEGGLEANLYNDAFAYILMLLFGQKPTTSTQVGATGVYKHTLALKDDELPLTATLHTREPNESLKYPYSVLSGLTLDIPENGFITFNADFMTRMPAVSNIAKQTVDDSQKFTRVNAVWRIADTVADLSQNASKATVISGNITFNNEVSNNYDTPRTEPDQSSITMGARSIEGELTLWFENSDVVAYVLNSNKKAASLTLSVGADATLRQVEITLSEVAFVDQTPEREQNAPNRRTVSFKCTGLPSAAVWNTKDTYA